MNHLYRIVWNAHAACWQAVCETAKGRGKGGLRSATRGVASGALGAEPRLRGSAIAVALALLALLGLPGLIAPAYAGPEGGNVVRGAASISSADKTTTINQSTDRAVINWSRFSVAADEAVRFNQPSNTSATLNRVTGAESSQIMGRLSANGHVFLINPNGVLIGSGAQVNVGGFVASTLDMDNDDFMSGKINLRGVSQAGVTNEGEITAEEGGTVVLIASEVNNTGTITANQGSVVLAGASSLTQGATTPAPTPAPAPSGTPATASAAPAASTVAAEPAPIAPATPAPEAVSSTAPAPSSAAEAAPVEPVTAPQTTTPAPVQIASGGGNTADKFTVRLQDGSNIAFTIDQGAVNALVNNGGLIQAQGGHVILTAKGRDDLSKASVNHSGVIEAQTTTTRNGVVELLADMKVGTVNLSGSINAAAVAPVPTAAPASTLRGGFVETSAAKVSVADSARVTTAGQIDAGIKTGTWLIDPVDFVIASSGGNMTGAALGSALNSSDVIVSTVPGQGTHSPSTTQPQGNGDIFVNEAVTWGTNQLTLSAERNIYINSTMNGTGGAKLALQYGQATSSGAGTDYHLNQATIDLGEGQNFSTKHGSGGTTTQYTVITRLGTEGDASTTTLQGINNASGGNYVLGANIDASSTSAWNGGQGFTPIENFNGNLHGLGHDIKNLFINRPLGYHIGLIAITDTYGDTVVRDLSLTTPNVTGYVTGALAGAFNGGTIKNVNVRGGAVTGDIFVGGLVGHLGYGSLLQTSSSSADVTGKHMGNTYPNPGGYDVGGLVGKNFQSTVANSFATGSVTANTNLGGLVGWLDGGSVINSYASGAVSGAGGVGGLIGAGGGSVVNSYWDTTTSGQSTSAGGQGKSTAEMKQQSTYAGWDFANVWAINEGSERPTLRALAPAPGTGTGSGTGSGTTVPPSPGGAPGGTVSPGSSNDQELRRQEQLRLNAELQALREREAEQQLLLRQEQLRLAAELQALREREAERQRLLSQEQLLLGAELQALREREAERQRSVITAPVEQWSNTEIGVVVVKGLKEDGATFTLEQLFGTLPSFATIADPNNAAQYRLYTEMSRALASPAAIQALGLEKASYLKSVYDTLAKQALATSKVNIGRELKVSMAAGAAISVIANGYSAWKLGDELDRLFAEMPFLEDQVSDS